MPKEIEHASRTTKREVTRTCLKCGKSSAITNYYTNRDWKERGGKDIWCKDCFGRIGTKDGLKEYFWENHRHWDEDVWNRAKATAEKSLNKNDTYKTLNEERRYSILSKAICQAATKPMTDLYKYEDTTNGGQYFSYSDWKAKNENSSSTVEDDDPDKKYYSKDFNGYFKKSDLVYLEDYYSKLEDDFNFDNESRRDYARKVCKASLQADKAQDDFMAGRCDYSVVKDAMTLFDMLSKSSNFAACKRKPGENNSGMSSWSELTLYLETNGHPCTKKIEWPKDDVDKTIDEFYYLTESLDLEGA